MMELNSTKQECINIEYMQKSALWMALRRADVWLSRHFREYTIKAENTQRGISE